MHHFDAILTLLYILLPGVLGYLHSILKADKEARIQLLLSYYLFIAVGIQGLVTGYMQMAMDRPLGARAFSCSATFSFR